MHTRHTMLNDQRSFSPFVWSFVIFPFAMISVFSWKRPSLKMTSQNDTGIRGTRSRREHVSSVTQAELFITYNPIEDPESCGTQKKTFWEMSKCVHMGFNVVLWPMCFKMSSFVFCGRKRVMHVWNEARKNFHFCANSPFKNAKVEQA